MFGIRKLKGSMRSDRIRGNMGGEKKKEMKKLKDEFELLFKFCC